MLWSCSSPPLALPRSTFPSLPTHSTLCPFCFKPIKTNWCCPNVLERVVFHWVWSTSQENCLSLDLHFKTLMNHLHTNSFHSLLLYSSPGSVTCLSPFHRPLPAFIHNARSSRSQTWDQVSLQSWCSLPLLFSRTLNTWTRVKQNDHDVRNLETKSCVKWRGGEKKKALWPCEEWTF